MDGGFHRWPRRVAIAGLLCALGAFSGGRACQICLPIPATSAAEHLLAAEVVVLAREDPQNPLSLRTVETLKGDPDAPPLDLFLDPASRRTLSLGSKRKIVCVYRSDGPVPGWVRIGTADSAFTPLVREVLARATAWKERPDLRVKYLAGLLGDQNQQVRTVAHLEVARAPYDEIKQFAGTVPAEDLRRNLKNFRLFEWHPLYILLLAQSGEAQDHELIAEKVRSAERTGSGTHLAAWVTAWIEIEEEGVLDFLASRYLGRADRRIDDVRSVLAALSVHGSRGHTHLRDGIVACYRDALTNYPALAPRIVRDLLAWERWELASAVTAIVDAPPPEADRSALLQLRSYLRRAGGIEGVAAGSEEGAPGKGSPLLLVLLAVLLLLPIVLGLLRGAKRGRNATVG